MSTPDLPPARGYSDPPQGEVCPPVQTGAGASLKTCPSCSSILPRSSFYRNKTKPDGLSALCKRCQWNSTKAWRDRHASYAASQKPHSRKRFKAWKAAHPERHAESRERYAATHHKEILESNKRWLDKRPAKRLEYRHRRRSLEVLAAGSGYTTAQHIEWRWQMYGGKCWICGGDADELDHVIPLTKGGSNWPANLRPACKHCNTKKGNRHERTK